jgi:hypothetical protein
MLNVFVSLLGRPLGSVTVSVIVWALPVVAGRYRSVAEAPMLRAPQSATVLVAWASYQQ